MDIVTTVERVLEFLKRKKTILTICSMGALAILQEWGWVNVPAWVYYVHLGLAVVFLKAGQNRIEAQGE